MKTDEPLVAFSKATEESIGDQPMIPDPYESRTVEVKRMRRTSMLWQELSIKLPKVWAANVLFLGAQAKRGASYSLILQEEEGEEESDH